MSQGVALGADSSIGKRGGVIFTISAALLLTGCSAWSVSLCGITAKRSTFAAVAEARDIRLTCPDGSSATLGAATSDTVKGAGAITEGVVHGVIKALP